MGMRVADNRLGSVISLYARELAGMYGQEEITAIVRTILSQRLELGDDVLLLDRERPLSESELLEIYLPLKRLRAGEPLQYILGEVVFHGLRIAVSPAVLIPRPETEELVSLIIESDHAAPAHIMDIGTGSGCIALALKKGFPEAEVVATDVSEKALEQAKGNARINGLELSLLRFDVLKEDPLLGRPLDLIVSNPPYIPRYEEGSLSVHVRDHEPHLALFVEGEDPLLFHRAIARLAQRHLRKGGQLWFETHAHHGAGVLDVVRSMDFSNARLLSDLSGNIRFVHAVR